MITWPRRFRADFDGLQIVADCGNGSASALAPELFGRLGAQIHAIHCSPNGRNINLNCGSLHLEALRCGGARAFRADVGVAFDGDADRAMFVAASGKDRGWRRRALASGPPSETRRAV